MYFKDNKIMNYVVSILWDKVKVNEVMLVWNMNGELFFRIYGYFFCVIVFGYIGVCNVKWFYCIKVIKIFFCVLVQSQEYFYFLQQVGKYNFVFIDGIQIQEMFVSFVIMFLWNK